MKRLFLCIILFASVLSFAQTRKDVTIYRGDKTTLTFLLKGDYSSLYSFRFVVKEDYTLTSQRKIYKVTGNGIVTTYNSTDAKSTVTISIKREDTQSLVPDFNPYVFDIEAILLSDTTDVTTVFRGNLIVQQDVGTPYDGTTFVNDTTRNLILDPRSLDSGFVKIENGAITSEPLYSKEEIDDKMAQAGGIPDTTDYALKNYVQKNFVPRTDFNLSTLATKEALGDSTAKLRNEIPDISGLLSSESDPVFSSSQAANITSNDIAKLGNTSGTNTGDETTTTIKSKLGISTLSGSNTGDQDLSSYAQKNNYYTRTQSDSIKALLATLARVDSLHTANLARINTKASKDTLQYFYLKTSVNTLLAGKVDTARTITINGIAYSLGANRSWTIAPMIYPSAGIALSTGSAWGTSIVDNSTNWNDAYTRQNWSGLTSGYVPYKSTTMVNSPIYTDGTKIVIGTTSLTHYAEIKKSSENQRTARGLNVDMTASTLQSDETYTGYDEAMINQYYAWSFVASSSHTVGSWGIRLKKTGTVTNTTDYIRVKIYSDNSGKPNSLLATSDNIKMGILTTSYIEYLFGVDLTLSVSTTYWIVVERSASVTGGGSISIDKNNASLTTTNVASPSSADWIVYTGKGRYKLYGQSPIAISGTSTNSAGVSGTSTNSYGISGTSTNSVGVSGTSTNSYGVYGASTNGYGGVIRMTGVQTAHNTSNTLFVERNSSGSYNATGNVLQITDYPIVSGTISGALISGSVDGTTRLNFDPRVTNGSTAVANMFDTKNTLSNESAKLLSLRNAGTEKFSVLFNGSPKFVSTTLLGTPQAGAIEYNNDFYLTRSSGVRSKILLKDSLYTKIETDTLVNGKTKFNYDGIVPSKWDRHIIWNGVDGDGDCYLSAGLEGETHTFIKRDTTSNILTIWPNGSEKIGGLDYLEFAKQNVATTIKFSQGNWWITGSNREYNLTLGDYEIDFSNLHHGYELVFDSAANKMKWAVETGTIDNANNLGGYPASSYFQKSDTANTTGTRLATAHDLENIPALTDGDKGDITIGNDGTTMTVDSAAITFAKMQTIPTNTILGRYGSGTGILQSMIMGNMFSLSGDTLKVNYNYILNKPTLGSLAALSFADTSLTLAKVISVNGKRGIVTLTTADIDTSGNKKFVSYSEKALWNSKIGLSDLSSTAPGLTYTAGVFSLASGYVIPTTTQESGWSTTKSRLDSLGIPIARLNSLDSLLIPIARLNSITGTLGSNAFNSTAFVPQTTTVNGNPLSGNVTVSDVNLSVTDVTTNNASTTAHGFAPKLPDDSTKWYSGKGLFQYIHDADTRTTHVMEIKLIQDATSAATTDSIIVCIPTKFNGMNLVNADAFVTTVSSSGTPTFTVKNITDGTNMLSTNITIDENEYNSYTAATAPVINGSYDDVATGDLIKVKCTTAGTGTKGSGIILVFQKP